MDKVPDRKKLRKEYLERKLGGYVQLLFGGAMFLPFFFAAAIGGIVTVLGCLASLVNGQIDAFFLCLVFGGLVTFVCGLFARLGYAVIQEGDRLAQTPYVPPVNADSLPAEEVLVRGSVAPPVAQSEVLLRAATALETPKEELLRVTTEK
jgi:hypothetical protein